MKAILLMDVDEELIGRIGTDIVIHNNWYKCNWKLKPMPNKIDIENNESEIEEAMDIGYVLGWNTCLEELEK